MVTYIVILLHTSWYCFIHCDNYIVAHIVILLHTSWYCYIIRPFLSFSLVSSTPPPPPPPPLSPLYTLLLFERFALLLPLLAYCMSDSGLHLLFLLPLFIITVLVWAVFLCVSLCDIVIWIFCCLSCIIWTIFVLFYSSPPPPPPPGRRVLALILKLSSLSSSFFLFFFPLHRFLWSAWVQMSSRATKKICFLKSGSG